jgi:hypothetical protein
VALKTVQQNLNAVSVEAILCAACISTKKTKTIFTHMMVFFGRNLVISEKKGQAYFHINDLPPKAGKHTLSGKAMIKFGG